MENRTPPHDEHAELVVIGCALLSPDTIDRVGALEAGDFFGTAESEAWAAIKAIGETGKPVDVLTVGDELRSRGMWERFRDGWQIWAMHACSSVTTTENVSYYAEIIRDKSAARKMISMCTEAIARAYGTGKAAEAIEGLRNGVAELDMFCTSADEPVRIGDAIGDVISNISERSRPGAPSALIPTGLVDFDRHLRGFSPDEKVTIAGRPGSGKSTWMFQIAEHAARHGFPVLAFSLEMSREQLIMRMLSGNSGISATSMRTGFDDDGEPLGLKAHTKILAAGESLAPLPIFIEDKIIPLGAMVSVARKWHAKHVEKSGKSNALIVVDYLQLAELATASAKMSREQIVATISRTLKKLNKELHCTVIDGCQLNREIEKRAGGEPQLSDLRESGSIEQDADMVLFVHRIKNGEEVDPSADEDAKIISGKNRNGPTGFYPAKFQKKTLRFVSRDDRHAEYDGPDTRPNYQDGADQ